MPNRKTTQSSSVPYLVDTCVFVHAFCNNANGSAEIVEASRQLFTRAEAGDIHVFVSAVTIAEILAINYLRSDDPRGPGTRKQRNEERKKLKAWLAGRTTTVEVDESLALAAGNLGHQHKFKGADAIIYASAIEAGVDALITTDKGLLKANTPTLPVLLPTDIGGQTMISIGTSETTLS